MFTVFAVTLFLSEQSYHATSYAYLIVWIHVGAVVSIQETEISIIEGTSGEICIVLENGDLERNVSVILTTTAGTAGTETILLSDNNHCLLIHITN